ncbi:MAG: hypothetical protein P8J87_19565 [Verrucomicrobiales bacterium]|nr:hypothetical protein [Verrucomicrobiales bacterium]
MHPEKREQVARPLSMDELQGHAIQLLNRFALQHSVELHLQLKSNKSVEVPQAALQQDNEEESNGHATDTVDQGHAVKEATEVSQEGDVLNNTVLTALPILKQRDHQPHTESLGSGGEKGNDDKGDNMCPMAAKETTIGG